MKKRSWDGKTKAKIVLEGLSGMATGELCGKLVGQSAAAD